MKLVSPSLLLQQQMLTNIIDKEKEKDIREQTGESREQHRNWGSGHECQFDWSSSSIQGEW